MSDEGVLYPESVDDFDPLVMGAREWMALADYCAQEVWVWEKVAESEYETETGREAAKRSAEVYRMKGRAYKAYAAQEEQKQTEWEERNKR